ncbi:uncharacterized protein EAE97_010704 [Botrytis byssoidea]|uniref:Uncharacterized protein n=1 Tax=Botrytis byssoidea TaxID=139641 RepID=A0A9P5I3B5_9HELO|nr:uncharacterized protein EAE97_010704 [Botrytis byssoidea]KAF7924092.1 hypothetical protein EAE97_010704 [Botrytis byssoidea]
MHLTKPALVVASLLWATTFASPIDSPSILRTRGLIGGSTTNDNTKDVAGSTTANNAVGNDNTKSASKSNAVEDAVGSLDLGKITGGLSAREVSRRHHGHKSQEGEIVDDALNIADDATPGGFVDRTTRRGTARDVSRRHHGHQKGGNEASDGAVGTTKNATGDDATSDVASSIVEDATRDGGKDATSAPGFFTDILRRLVTRDKDGTVHDANHAANQAVHDANHAVHEANEAVHNTVHGLLHGILR